jgi:hypothetical protein
VSDQSDGDGDTWNSTQNSRGKTHTRNSIKTKLVSKIEVSLTKASGSMMLGEEVITLRLQSHPLASAMSSSSRTRLHGYRR